jgi:hypothetical protein
MSQLIIDVGAIPNDGEGDPLRNAFIKINDNFTELFEQGTGNLSVTGNITAGNISVSGNIAAQNIISASGNIETAGYFVGLFAGSITGNIVITGSNTQVLFNNGGIVGADAGLTFDYVTDTLTLGGPFISAGNISTAQGISAAGNVNTGNIINAGFINSTGQIQTSSYVSATGNITGAYLNGNAAQLTIPASSGILYVAKNGNDANDGSLNKPFLTIAAAMTAAVTGNISVHVAPGYYTEVCPITIPQNCALMGDNLRNVFIQPSVASSDMFYMTNGSYVWGVTVRNYTGNAFSYNPATPGQNVFVSPYIQNLTSSTTTGTAVYVDGDLVSSISTKAFIVGFFTIINRGGIGIHLLNSAYSQSVNIYTIACDIGIQVESGAFITLNGSDCSIGNFGLVADGYGPLQTSGNLISQVNGTFVIGNLSNGQPHVNTIMFVGGDPTAYTIDTIAPNTPAAGNATVVIQETYTNSPAAGTGITFYTRSSIIASAHTFEYVGAGTNPATALPQYGGIPIEANEVVATGNAVITFTSTDQKGNFKVGEQFVVNQATATITGDAFYKSLFAQMTPYILALSEN